MRTRLAWLASVFLPYAGLNGTEIDFGEPLRFTIVFAIPFVTAALAVPLATAAVLAWRAHSSGRSTRVHLAAIAVAAVIFPFFLGYWRLFGVGG